MASTEATVLPTEIATAPAAAVETPKADKKKKVVKVKKVPAPKKRTAAHPSYFQMVEEAIVTLKERTGSSQYAIQKFVEDKHKDLPANFRKLLLVQLRKLVANGKLLKLKGSYKLPLRSSKPAPVKALPAKPKAKPVAKAAAAKPKAAPAKAKASLKRKAPETAKKPVAKVAKKSVKATPSKKVKKAPVAKKETPVKKAVVVKKATPKKVVKPKTVKSPAKKVAAKKGKK